MREWKVKIVSTRVFYLTLEGETQEDVENLSDDFINDTLNHKHGISSIEEVEVIVLGEKARLDVH